MTKPALTAREWELGPQLDEPVGPEKEMALANHALPSDSPYKLMRGDVGLLRKIAPRFGEGGKRRNADLALAARIEALLPPEG